MQFTLSLEPDRYSAIWGVETSMQTGVGPNQRWYRLLDLWSVSSRAGVNLFLSFCYVFVFARISSCG